MLAKGRALAKEAWSWMSGAGKGFMSGTAAPWIKGKHTTLRSNEGYNSFSAIMGGKRFSASARMIGRGAKETYRGAQEAGGMMQAGMRGPAVGRAADPGLAMMGKGFKGMGSWISGAGSGTTGLKRAGVIAARAGAPVTGLAAADFLNPWGLGWGD